LEGFEFAGMHGFGAGFLANWICDSRAPESMIHCG
jgi:hypothetical protein